MPTKTAIILSAGLGTRMKSDLPKVLHKVAGRSMVSIVAMQLEEAGVDEIRVVVGYGADLVRQELKDFKKVKFYTQQNQLGTADAVKAADIDSLSGVVLICNGDHPLITAQDYGQALNAALETDLLVTSCNVNNPKEFGRIVRGRDKEFLKIIESKQANPSELKIKEVNTGLYVVKAEVLKKYLPQIKNNNAKKEYYLTDIVELALRGERVVRAKAAKNKRVMFGVNNKLELYQANRALYLRKLRELMLDGVTIIDAKNTYIEKDCEVGAGSVIEPGVMIKGRTKIGKNCHIEAHCQITDSEINDDVKIKWGTIIEKSVVGKKSTLGPYARLRPETVVGEEVHLGNFVELKKATIGNRSKANHLTYLGDCEIGEDTNIGCGTITCNYAVDKKKYKTTIGSDVFVGSDTQFIAPVTVGDGAVIGSGSTITKDVPSAALAVSRAKQFIKEGYRKK
ncbi:MAG: bifunctional UDP-N-acetylglucosamine diphosphorylase/glucosamine-1-phosphate N-acetyltransferase GlmU [Oligoflexia bacterium]|nr:bifunctional UDP-N-acetylglucosamine diphosphorylase/glucosamine-1-phosphate N-acetyltransferase GlmU [Oligoflexia bacterium]